MKKLTPKEKRKNELLKFGAPKSFVENIGLIKELTGRMEDVDGAYFYLPQIADYKLLQDQNVIPVFDEGENFCVVIYNDEKAKIIRFSLENDTMLKDYGLNWNLLLFDIMFQYFEDEIERGLYLEKFTEVGNKIDFNYSELLFHKLNIPVEDYSEKYKDVENWKKELTKELKILANQTHQ